MAKLNKRSVDAIKPEPKRDIVTWDDDLVGFGLRVKPSGVKSYLIQYRNRDRVSRRYTFAKHGVLTPDEARDRARKLLSAVTDGHDPAAEKAEPNAALTVRELAEIYLREGPAEKPNKKRSSWITDRSNIERHIKPLLGRRVARSLSQADIAKFQVDVATGKSKADIRTKKRGRAIVEGGRGTAARSLAVLGAMLQFAVGRRLIMANPAKGVPLLKGVQKGRFLCEAEVARLADTLVAMENEHKVSTTAATAVRLLLLTGCRKSEILSLRWEWVETGRGCLRLPDSKTGAKVVPLASAALELLTGLPDRSEFVLPAAKGEGHYTGLQKDWERIRERASLPGLRIHDLRHSFASFAVADGSTLFMVGKLLGHKQTRTTEVYAHLASDPLRAAADRTAARIAAAIKNTSREAAEVVNLLSKGESAA